MDVFHRHLMCERPRSTRPHGARQPMLPATIREPFERDEERQLWLWSLVVPDRRPKLFAFCECIGLGDRIPCPFATCTHSLLSDELRGEMLAEVDLWEKETCSLAVAGRGRHSSVELAKLTGHCETSIEETSRRCIRALKEGLGVDEFDWPPKHHGFKPDHDGMTEFSEQVARTPERPGIIAPPVRHLTRREVAAVYGRKLVHADYGQAKVPEPGKAPVVRQAAGG